MEVHLEDGKTEQAKEVLKQQVSKIDALLKYQYLLSCSSLALPPPNELGLGFQLGLGLGFMVSVRVRDAFCPVLGFIHFLSCVYHYNESCISSI